MQVFRCRRPLRGVECRRCFRHHGFKGFGSARDDFSIDKLPADTFVDKEFIDLSGKTPRIVFTTVFVVSGESWRARPR